MELNELIKNVQQWSIDRGLDKADSKKQLLKLYEEFGELASGIAKKQPGVIMDSIGDCVVVLIILAQQQKVEVSNIQLEATIGDVHDVALMMGKLARKIIPNCYQGSDELESVIIDTILLLEHCAKSLKFSFEDCLEMAWNAIKDRKGKLVDGVWVKEEDLPTDIDYFSFKCGPDEIREVSPEQTLDAVIEDDVVNNPSHYFGSDGLEVREIMRQFAPCPEYIEGGYWTNTVEYLLRAPKKNGVEDLKKARKNLDWLIEELENGNARKGVRSL